MYRTCRPQRYLQRWNVAWTRLAAEASITIPDHPFAAGIVRPKHDRQTKTFSVWLNACVVTERGPSERAVVEPSLKSARNRRKRRGTATLEASSSSALLYRSTMSIRHLSVGSGQAGRLASSDPTDTSRTPVAALAITEAPLHLLKKKQDDYYY